LRVHGDAGRRQCGPRHDTGIVAREKVRRMPVTDTRFRGMAPGIAKYSGIENGGKISGLFPLISQDIRLTRQS